MKRALMAGILVFLFGGATGTAAPFQSQAPKTDLEKEIVNVLWALPHYGVFDNLAFETDGTNVTLMGQALFEITKAEAAKRVAKIKGVGTVTNKIEVLPPSPSDDALRMALYRRIFGTHDLYRYSMGADGDGGYAGRPPEGGNGGQKPAGHPLLHERPAAPEVT
jgi:hypothetical protein